MTGAQTLLHQPCPLTSSFPALFQSPETQGAFPDETDVPAPFHQSLVPGVAQHFHQSYIIINPCLWNSMSCNHRKVGAHHKAVTLTMAALT